jgi:hypothetical protein
VKIALASLIVSAGLVYTPASLAQCQGSKASGQTVAAKAGGCCKDGAAKDKAGCSGKDAAGKENCDPAKCAGKAGGMPKMSYKVGDQTLCCPTKAGELAQGDATKIHYIVANKEYTDKAEATQAYQAALDGYLQSVTSVRFAVGDEVVTCPNAAQQMAKTKGESVKFRVAAYTFADRAAAEKAAAAANDAAGQVTMKTVVNGKTYTCEKEAAAACAASGKSCHGEAVAKGDNASAGDAAKPEYVIGETKTNCAVTAKVELAKAKIAAAQQALEKFQQTAGKDAASNNDPTGA